MNASLRSFFSFLAPDQVLDSPEDLAFYGRDSCKDFIANPGLILHPKNLREVQQILKVAHDSKIAIVPSGGRTGYSGGATATNGEVVLSLVRLNKILEVSLADMTLRCEAGVTTEAVRIKAAEHGLCYPVDFSSKGSSHIGGNVATNAGGIRVIRYGNTRDWVLGLKVVMPGGELLDLNGALFKNNTGYDLRGLMIGSEGTLGIIVEVLLKLTTPPAPCELALAASGDAAHVPEILKALRERGFVVNVFEYFERNALEKVLAATGLKDPFSKPSAVYSLIEVERSTSEVRERFEAALADLLEGGLVSDAVLSESERHYQDLMALRERISEVLGKHHTVHKNDLSVPVSTIPAFIKALREVLAKRYPTFEPVIFGHIGDGNLHVNILKPPSLSDEAFFKECHQADPMIFEVVKRFGGSISAEHGVGLLKMPYLHFSRSPAEIALLKGIKDVFDPRGILNPQKIFLR